MNIAIPLHRVTQKAVERLCQRIADMGGVSNHDCHLCADQPGIADESVRILEGVFRSVTVRVVCRELSGWPARENEVFRSTSQEFQYVFNAPWLRVEADSDPRRETWADEIESAWLMRGKKHILAGETGNPDRFCGCAVFPPNLINISLYAFQTQGNPWFVSGNREMRAHALVTPLMSEKPTEETALALRQRIEGFGQINRHCFVQLGRFGDILNILPLMNHVNRTEGKPLLMVHKEFAEVAQDLDYVDVDVWDGGAWSDLSLAVEAAQSKYRKVSVCQIHGDRHQAKREAASFCIDAWKQAGYEKEFGRHGLFVFSHDANAFDIRPDVIISSGGTSSPFQSTKELVELVESTGLKFRVISGVKAARLTNLLSLYERASCLITTDTATLHLAQASDIPVIALLADTPTSWHGSTPKGNCVLSLRYSEFPARKDDILTAIRRNRRGVVHSTKLHIFQDYPGTGDTKRRNDLARETWERECVSSWHPVGVGGLPRTARTIGDARDMFFIKDVIDAGVSGFGDDTYAMFTNTDTCIRSGLTHEINRLTGEAYFSHRRDFPRLERPLAINEIERGTWYAGSDLFVFKVGWWKKHRDEMPDMILGAEGWDKILRQLVKDTGGGEIHLCCYHERHQSVWETTGNRHNDPSNKYCRILARQWLRERGHPVDEMGEFKATDGDLSQFEIAQPKLEGVKRGYRKHVKMKPANPRKQLA
jgi:hypothetical protein